MACLGQVSAMSATSAVSANQLVPNRDCWKPVFQRNPTQPRPTVALMRTLGTKSIFLGLKSQKSQLK